MSTKNNIQEDIIPEFGDLNDLNDLSDDATLFAPDSGELTRVLTSCSEIELMGALVFLLGYLGPTSQYDADAAHLLRKFVQYYPKFCVLALDIPGIVKDRSRLEH